MRNQSIVRRSVIAVLVLMLFTAAGRAGAGQLEDTSRSVDAIVGSWVEMTTVTGGPPPFAGLLTFGADGTLVTSYQGSVTTSGPFQASFTPGQGEWIREGGRTYSTTAVQVVSGLDGSLWFTNTLRQRITLSRAKDTYRSVVRAEFRDPAGNLVFAMEGTTEGRRIHVDPLP